MSTEEAEEKEIRLFSSFPSKTGRGRGPICGLTFTLFMVLTKGILKMWLPLCFPLGLHLWLATEARGLKLGHLPLGPGQEAAALTAEDREGGMQGLHRKNDADTTKGILDTARIRPGLNHCRIALAPPEAGCRPGA